MNSPSADRVLPDNALETERLSKVYRGRDGEKHALKEVSLAVPRGSFFALLGPNGAGKSTFINILAGLVNKTAGSARIWGHDITEEMRLARSSIGIVPQEVNLDTFFTPRQALELQAGFYGVPKAERRTLEILRALGLEDKADAYSRSLSGGMRRRLLAGKAMVHNPPVLVLDEPTAGVDIELRRRLWDYVRDLNAQGVTILLTTHYLEEAEELCDHIAIIDRGRVVACEDKPTLMRRLDGKTLTLTTARPLRAMPETLARWRGRLKNPHQMTMHYRPGGEEVTEILSAVNALNLDVSDITTKEATLEDIFLMLTRDAGVERAGSA